MMVKKIVLKQCNTLLLLLLYDYYDDDYDNDEYDYADDDRHSFDRPNTENDDNSVKMKIILSYIKNDITHQSNHSNLSFPFVLFFISSTTAPTSSTSIPSSYTSTSFSSSSFSDSDLNIGKWI